MADLERYLTAIPPCRELAAETAQRAANTATALGTLAAMFIARAMQSLSSVGLLASEGLNGDAMAVARTPTELAIDLVYISRDPQPRIDLFMSHDHVAQHKLAKAICEMNRGTAHREAMRVRKARAEAAESERATRGIDPAKGRDWEGSSVEKRARAIGDAKLLSLYTVVYADMCMASHSGFATLEYALTDRVGTNATIMLDNPEPDVKAVGHVCAATLTLIATTVEACKLPPSLRARGDAIAATLEIERS